MSLTTIFDFETPSDYTLTNIAISGGEASLALVANPGQTFEQPFTAATGFTYDSAYTLIAGGVLSQISQLIIPTFQDLVNVVTGTGSVTKNAGGTLWNAGVISNETLTGSGLVEFITNANTNDQMAGLALSNPGGNFTGIDYAIYFTGGTVNIYELGNPVASEVSTYITGDVFQVKVTGTTVTYLKNGSVIYTSLVAATFPLYFACAILNVGDVVSSIQLQNAATQFVGDSITYPAFNYPGIGSIIGFTGFTTGGDVNSPGYILDGRYWNGSAWVSSDGSYAQSSPLATFVAHLATLPNANTFPITTVTNSGSSGMSITGPLIMTYSGQIYSIGTFQSHTSFTADMLLTFTSVFSESGSDSVTFALVVNSVLTWWNGSAWVASNGTLAQTNTAAVINTNAGSLLSMNSIINVFGFLQSGTGSTTPNVTSITAMYTFGAINPTEPATTIVYGFLRDIVANPVVGANIIFSLVTKTPNAYMAAVGNVLIASQVIAVTDSNGFFSQPVIATTQFQGTDTFIQVVIQSGSATENVTSAGAPLYLTIPIQASIDITDILSG